MTEFPPAWVARLPLWRCAVEGCRRKRSRPRKRPGVIRRWCYTHTLQYDRGAAALPDEGKVVPFVRSQDR